jgi:AAA domain
VVRTATEHNMTDPVLTAVELLRLISADGNTPGLTFKTLTEWRAEYTAPAWLVRGFMTRDAFDVIGGAEKSLKSWLMHHCAIAVAAGRPLFGDPTMWVPQPAKVVLLTGEGGVNLVLDRVEHLCIGVYDITLDDVADRIVVSADIAPMSSTHFGADIGAVLAEHDPALVQLDPMYVYLGEDREAGNVYSVGPALMALRTLTLGRALQVAHHFTKAAASKLTLGSLTQAGMREAVDHWLLISVDEFDLAAQRFVLDIECGAPPGLAWSRRAEVVLGPFDEDTLRHVGKPSFVWQARSSAASNWQKVQACAQQATNAAAHHAQTSDEGLPQNWLEARLTGSTDIRRAGIAEARLRGSLRTAPGPRNSTLHWYAEDYIIE